jgi:hypothetical protein
MKMLDAVFAHAEPLYDEAYVTGGSKLQRKIDTWKDALVDEKIEDLEEYMGILNSLVPNQLSEEPISWIEPVEVVGEKLVIGRMLCWLCLLRLTEIAAFKDVRNRLASSSVSTNAPPFQ